MSLRQVRFASPLPLGRSNTAAIASRGRRWKTYTWIRRRLQMGASRTAHLLLDLNRPRVGTQCALRSAGAHGHFKTTSGCQRARIRGSVTVALWLLIAGIGVFAVTMAVSLCMVAARPAPTPPGLGALAQRPRPRPVAAQPADAWMDFTHPPAELHPGEGIS